MRFCVALPRMLSQFSLDYVEKLRARLIFYKLLDKSKLKCELIFINSHKDDDLITNKLLVGS